MLLDRARLPVVRQKPQRRSFPINLLLMFLLGFIGVKAFTAVSQTPLTGAEGPITLESVATIDEVPR